MPENIGIVLVLRRNQFLALFEYRLALEVLLLVKRLLLAHKVVSSE